MAKTKKDGRANNGRVSEGLTEASFLVRMPTALKEAMAARGKATGIPVVVLWRRAAEQFLAEK
jgi:hypothetical protein